MEIPTQSATTVDDWLAGLPARSHDHLTGRPLVTLSYAQSLDGSLADRQGRALGLSSPASMRLTHRVRAAHAAILVGIGTVLADNPRLNVRLVEGSNPRPVVIDSRLRIPLACHLIDRADNLPWIFCGPDAPPEKAGALHARGARVIPVAYVADGGLDLDEVLARLSEMGCGSVMVEGGARVLSSMLTRRLFDYALITIAPVWVGGRASLDRDVAVDGRFPALEDVVYLPSGTDMIVLGRRAEKTGLALPAVLKNAGEASQQDLK